MLWAYVLSVYNYAVPESPERCDMVFLEANVKGNSTGNLEPLVNSSKNNPWASALCNMVLVAWWGEGSSGQQKSDTHDRTTSVGIPHNGRGTHGYSFTVPSMCQTCWWDRAWASYQAEQGSILTLPLDERWALGMLHNSPNPRVFIYKTDMIVLIVLFS